MQYCLSQQDPLAVLFHDVMEQASGILSCLVC